MTKSAANSTIAVIHVMVMYPTGGRVYMMCELSGGVVFLQLLHLAPSIQAVPTWSSLLIRVKAKTTNAVGVLRQLKRATCSDY